MDSRFYDYTDLIIGKYEGGYYHPHMMRDDPARFPASVYGKSGETMYGIDRDAGGSINTGAAGREFWGLIDAQQASTRWGWNYKPTGELDKRLRRLCAEIMYGVYSSYVLGRLSDKAKKLVDKSPRLQAHLFYGCWNGIGYLVGFSGVKGFVTIINEAVANGTRDLGKLEAIALESRRKHPYSFMRERAKNMEAIYSRLPAGGGISGWVVAALIALPLAGLAAWGYSTGRLKGIRLPGLTGKKN